MSAMHEFENCKKLSPDVFRDWGITQCVPNKEYNLYYHEAIKARADQYLPAIVVAILEKLAGDKKQGLSGNDEIRYMLELPPDICDKYNLSHGMMSVEIYDDEKLIQVMSLFTR